MNEDADVTRCEKCEEKAQGALFDAIMRFGDDRANREKLAAWLGVHITEGAHVSPVRMDDTFAHVLSKFVVPSCVVATLEDGQLVFYNVTKLEVDCG